MSQEQEMTNEVQPTSGAFTLTKQDNGAVSYTHLTLPTSDLV